MSAITNPARAGCAGLLLLLLVVLTPASPASARALGAAGIAKLAAGEVLITVSEDPSGSAALIDAVIDIPVPRKLLWAVMLDCSRMSRVIKGLESCKVIQRAPDGAWDVREHLINWTWFLPNLRSVFRSDFFSEQRISFRRVEGDLAILEGEWRLEPIAGTTGTRLFYKNRIGTSLPVPGWIVRDALERDVPQTLKDLRAESVRAAGR